MTKASLPTRDTIFAAISIYEQYGFNCSQFTPEPEGAAYGASSFKLNGKAVRLRIAKTTPAKSGQFVTLWKRSATGHTVPFDEEDNIGFVIISARIGARAGHFVFPETVLILHKIISKNAKGGKRGFRIYPPWETATNSQAIVTQQWQARYFFEIAGGKIANVAGLLALLKA